MQLITNGRFVTDTWSGPTALQGRAVPHTLYTAATLLAAPPADYRGCAPLGLLIDSETNISTLLPLLPQLALIAIAFPATGDGRGFSLARQLRRHAYVRELRAHGELIADQYPHLRAAGFDSIQVPQTIVSRHTELDWQKAWRQFPQRYQASAGGLASVWARRHPVTAQTPASRQA